MDVRQLSKKAMLATARALGVNSCLRALLRHRLLVLSYHEVIPDDSPADRFRTRVATRVSEFVRQMEILCRHFKPVSADDLLDHVENGTTLPPHAVLVTFDDGFRNNLICAAPELERMGIPALIHVTSGHIGQDRLLWTQELGERIVSWKNAALPMPRGRPDIELSDDINERWALTDKIRGICKRLPHEERIAYLERLRQEPLTLEDYWRQDLFSFLSWDEVRSLDARGFSIGSHTVNHPILTTLSPEAVDSELAESKSHIERELGKPCPWLAYPNGGPNDFSPEVVSSAESAGYKIAFTLIGRTNPRSLNPLEIDRVCVPSGLSENGFRARVNGILTFSAN